METIILAGSVVGALGILFSTLIKFYIFLRTIENKIDSYEHTMNENTKSIYKLMLFNEELDLVDRLHAGEEYLALHGNGDGKLKYEQLLKEREQEKYKN